MGNGMRGMQGTQGMFIKIPGNVLEDSGECSHFSIPGNSRKNSGNVREDSGECSRRFQRMLLKIPGNVIKDSVECSRRFQGMFHRIPGNVQEDSGGSKFWFTSWNLAYFLSNFAVKMLRYKGKKQFLSNSSKENIFVTTTYNFSSELNYYFPYLITFSFPFLSFLCWGKRVITVRRDRSIKKL